MVHLSLMRELNSGNFGIVISYLLPGFVTLSGLSFFSNTVAGWLSPQGPRPATVGGFLYATLASLACGMTVSAIRWAVADTIHHITGIRKPRFDFSKLKDSTAAFVVLIEVHYHYYLCYANTALALAFTCVAYVISKGWGSAWVLAAILPLEVVFWLASRDALRKYYRRAGELLEADKEQEEGPLIDDPGK